MSTSENVVDHDMVYENKQSSINLLFFILQETQLKLDNKEKRMNEMTTHMGHNHRLFLALWMLNFYLSIYH